MNSLSVVQIMVYKLSEQIENLSRELQRVRDELAEARRSGEEEEQQLQSVMESLAAERDQLKLDLQENVELVGLCAAVLPNHPRLLLGFFCLTSKMFVITHR